MKCIARNLKVREQLMNVNGLGVRLSSQSWQPPGAEKPAAKYALTVEFVGNDGRRLEIALDQDEVEQIVARYAVQKRYNAGDFSNVQAPVKHAPYDPSLTEQIRTRYEPKTHRVRRMTKDGYTNWENVTEAVAMQMMRTTEYEVEPLQPGRDQ